MNNNIICKLPFELICEIGSWMNVEDLKAFSATSKGMNTTMQSYWEYLCKKNYQIMLPRLLEDPVSWRLRYLKARQQYLIKKFTCAIALELNNSTEEKTINVGNRMLVCLNGPSLSLKISNSTQDGMHTRVCKTVILGEQPMLALAYEKGICKLYVDSDFKFSEEVLFPAHDNASLSEKMLEDLHVKKVDGMSEGYKGYQVDENGVTLEFFNEFLDSEGIHNAIFPKLNFDC